jgi:hypothetical protein
MTPRGFELRWAAPERDHGAAVTLYRVHRMLGLEAQQQHSSSALQVSSSTSSPYPFALPARGTSALLPPSATLDQWPHTEEIFAGTAHNVALSSTSNAASAYVYPSAVCAFRVCCVNAAGASPWSPWLAVHVAADGTEAGGIHKSSQLFSISGIF